MNTNKINYQKELDKIIENNIGQLPRLLLHGCCAPCSSYVLEYLSQYFKITLLFYNPNISDREEFLKRGAEVKRLINSMAVKNEVEFIIADEDFERFEEIAVGLENAPEGGARCLKCYELRLRKTAELAKKYGFDYFTTTLSISPLKNSQKLNQIGESLGSEYGVKHLPSDFKKKEGYKRSIQLSKDFGLYRQNYCGCRFSKNTENSI